MTNKSKVTIQPEHMTAAAKRMLPGAITGLVLISVFLLRAGWTDPAWDQYWMIRPLIVVPLAGAMGGLFHYLMDYYRQQGGWQKVLVNVLSFIVFIIALWLGSVLGLAGTYWN